MNEHYLFSVIIRRRKNRVSLKRQPGLPVSPDRQNEGNNMKIWALGDAVVDLLPVGEMRYQACAGGAPFNVVVGAARLAAETAFIGRVGEDTFGRFLRDQIADFAAKKLPYCCSNTILEMTGFGSQNELT